MLRFLVRLFAFIGFVVIAGIVVGVVVTRQPAALPRTIVLDFDLDPPIADLPPQDALLSLFGHKASLRDVIDALLQGENDPRVKGLIMRLGASEPGFAATEELAGAIRRFRASGRFAIAYSESFGEGGGGSRSYALASAFDEIWLQPLGVVGLTGFSAEVPFARAALDQLGVKPEFQQREEFKSFAETFTQNDFSPAHRLEMTALIGDLGRQTIQAIAEGRKLAVDEVRALVDRGPLTDREALAARLVDQLGYRDQADDAAEARAGKGAATVDLLDYLDAAGAPHDEGPTVALIHVAGAITRGDGEARSLGENEAGSDTLVQAFQDAVDDDEVQAILLRIDSPGGSVTASEAIRRAVVQAREAGKPVIVSMGDTAASGGYWIAMNANRILADAGTVTGSIGVVGGKFSAKELSERLGVHWGQIAEGRNAGMWSPFSAFTSTQRERLTAIIDASYTAFLDKVADARRLAPEQVRAAAKGRVWTGTQALALGLIDEVGDQEAALAAVRKAIGLAPSAAVTLQPFPEPRSTLDELLALAAGDTKLASRVASRLGARMIADALPPWLAEMTRLGGQARGGVSFTAPPEAGLPVR